MKLLRNSIRKVHAAIGVIGCILLLCAPYAKADSAFTVSAEASTLTIHPGDQGVPLKVSVGSSSYAGPISITMTGLPSGITTRPLTLAAGSTGTLMLDATLSADQEAFLPTALGAPPNRLSTVTVVAFAGSEQATATITLSVSISNDSFSPESGDQNLPVIKIDTSGVAIKDKTTDVPGTITITSADGQTSYLPDANDSDNTATFHLHGNSTLDMPKLSYAVKLHTGTDLLHTMGLSCPYVDKKSGAPTCDKSKSYVLLANFDDKSLLRDWAASKLANSIPFGQGYLDASANAPTPSGTGAPMPWAPHSLFVDLYLNGAYEGVYQLIEKVGVDDNRINIHELSASDTSATDVTGGYLMEIDQRQDEAFTFRTPRGVPIGLDDPSYSSSPQVPQQTDYISKYVVEAENALFSSTFTNPTTGWRKYFDLASAVNYYIVNDVMGNVDGGSFYSSVYLYKEKGNPLLYMGPIWDFDISSGNTYYSAIFNPTIPWTQTAPWYKQWFQDPGFKQAVTTQFDKLESSGAFDSWLDAIRQEASALELAQQNNFKRWPILGIEVWPNAEAAGSYENEVAYLLNYLQLRIAYLDATLNAKATTATALTLSASTVKSGESLTLNAQVTGGISPGGTVAFFISQPVTGTGLTSARASLDSNGKADAVLSGLPPGSYNWEAVYEGDTKNAPSASSPVSVSVIAPPAASATSISGPTSQLLVGDSATFTASVIGSSGSQPPTGTVTFTANGVALGDSALSTAGIATLTTAALPAGTNSIEAHYNADGNYRASVSPALTVAVVPPAPPSFDLTLTPPEITVKAGSSAVATITVTPENGFHQEISFGCSGLPVTMQCTFSPKTLTPDGSAATISVSISGSSAPSTTLAWIQPITGGLVLGLIVWLPGRRRKYPLLRVLILVSIGMVAIGCGSSAPKSSAPETYNVTITASSSSLSKTAPVSVEIIP